MAKKVKFKDSSNDCITINGYGVVYSKHLNEDVYNFLVSKNKKYADLFVVTDEAEPAKAK